MRDYIEISCAKILNNFLDGKSYPIFLFIKNVLYIKDLLNNKSYLIVIQRYSKILWTTVFP